MAEIYQNNRTKSMPCIISKNVCKSIPITVIIAFDWGNAW